MNQLQENISGIVSIYTAEEYQKLLKEISEELFARRSIGQSITHLKKQLETYPEDPHLKNVLLNLQQKQAGNLFDTDETYYPIIQTPIEEKSFDYVSPANETYTIKFGTFTLKHYYKNQIEKVQAIKTTLHLGWPWPHTEKPNYQQNTFAILTPSPQPPYLQKSTFYIDDISNSALVVEALMNFKKDTRTIKTIGYQI